MTGSWAPTAPTVKYAMGINAPLTSSPTATPLNHIGGISEASAAATSALHHHSPLFWFAAISAVAFGLMAASTSTSVRVGPIKAHAGVSAGDDE